jgi:hypothetical protein
MIFPRAVSGSPFEVANLMPPSLFHKENSVRHQIRFHSVVGTSLHQRNLAALSPARFVHAIDFLRAVTLPIFGGVSVMAIFPF